MSFAKFDDGFASHPKVRQLGDAAFRLHVSGILHSARWLTDGVVDERSVHELLTKRGNGMVTAAKKELTDCGLWVSLLDGSAYEIHDYLDWNDSRAKVEHRRALSADRLARWRSENPKGDTA